MKSSEDETESSIELNMETLGALWYMCMNVYGPVVMPFILFLLLMTNNYLAIVIIIYIIWFYYFDRDTPEQGGRRSTYIQKLKIWTHFKNYFPIELKRDEFYRLSEKKNYLFCYFPPGTAGVGDFLSFGTASGGFNELFPNHKPSIFGFNHFYKTPLYRDYVMSFGYCKATWRSVKRILSNKDGGNAAVLIIGDASKAEYDHPNVKIWLVPKNKKGFIKLAIKTGTTIIPVIGFGELDIFDKPNMVIHKTGFEILYNWLKTDNKIIPTLKNSVLPRRRPINVIVGKPIDIKQVPNPTTTEIDFVHKMFIFRLTELFEKYKYTYLSDPDNTHLMLI